MSKNVPEVRFEGFSEEWLPINLSELMDFSNGINAPKESYGKGRKMISVMDILDESYLKYENIRSSVEVSPSIEEKNKVEYGDLIFVRSSEVSEEVGWSKAYLEKEYALYSGFSIRGKKKGSFNPSFVELSLNYTNRQQIERKAGGSTRFNISQTILNTIEILKASYEEQQKIGDFFKQLNDIIALQQQLVERQRQYKKAMLQKMFPRNGYKKPEIRFEGFMDDWQQRKLRDVLNVSKVKNVDNIYSKEDVVSVSREVGTVNQIEYQGRSFAGKDISNYKIIQEGDIVYTKSPLKGAPYGIFQIVTLKGILSPLYAVYKSTEFINAPFVALTLKEDNIATQYLAPLVSKGAKNTINITDEGALEGNILFPSLNEQNKIIHFFKQLDDTIALHQKKLEDYQQLKKALLQRMFV